MMAGDWIKMRVDLGDDPAVVQIAARLDTTEDEVVGKLHRLWSWADKHTTDGTAPGITPKWVDRYVSCTGFADAMVSASWLSFDESGIAFPGFDRHNGESAKRRVEATLRQRLSRKNRDEGVTGVARSTIPRPFIRYVMRRDAYTCVYCGEESSEAQENSKKSVLSVDHVKPISRGGAASVDNLACCCRKCNGEKNDRTPEEWGLLPTFLQPGVSYIGERFVTEESQKFCDTSATREEKDKNINTPITPKGVSPVGINTFLETCKQVGELPVPEDDPVFGYADKVGIPVEYLRLTWREFVDRNRETGKRYKDWRMAFRKCVRSNWYKIWFISPDGSVSLTTNGMAALKLHQEAA